MEKTKIGLMLVAGIAALLALAFEMMQDADTAERDKVQERLHSLESQATSLAISAAQERAGAANKAAGDANERAAQLEKEAADARLKQQELSKETEQLHNKNLQLALSLEFETRERQRFARKVSDRVIHPNALREQMEAFAGTKVLVEYTRDEPESRTLAVSIATGLAWAKWQEPNNHNVSARKVSRFNELFGGSGPYETGMMVAASGDNRTAASALVDALRSMDVFVRGPIANFWQPDVVYVLVGLKNMPQLPPPPFNR